MHICYHVYKSVMSFCKWGTRFVKSSPDINIMLQNVARKRKIQETNMYAKIMQSANCEYQHGICLSK